MSIALYTVLSSLTSVDQLSAACNTDSFPPLRSTLNQHTPATQFCLLLSGPRLRRVAVVAVAAVSSPAGKRHACYGSNRRADLVSTARNVAAAAAAAAARAVAGGDRSGAVIPTATAHRRLPPALHCITGRKMCVSGCRGVSGMSGGVKRSGEVSDVSGTIVSSD